MEEDTQSVTPDKMNTARRWFLKLIVAVTTFLISVILGVPLLRSLIVSKSKGAKQVWHKVADLDSLPEGKPMKLNFFARTEDAYRHETTVHSVWAVKHSPLAATVYSPICTHLGCYFKWNPGSGNFECPCHGSVFAADGKVIGGPAPRNLDTLQARIENGALFVIWEQFKVGIPEKVSL